MSTEPKEAAPMPALVERLRAMYAAAYPDGQHDRTDLGKERFALAFVAVNELPGLLDRIASLEAEVAALRKDGQRLEAVRENCWDLRSIALPTGAGDADVGWQVIEHHMAEPRERVVAEFPHDNLRAAIDSAIAAKGK